MEIVTKLDTVLTGALGPMGPLFVLLGLGLVLILAALPALLNRRPDRYEQLRSQRDRHAPETARALRTDKGRAKGAEKLEKYSTFLEPKTAEELSASRLKLLRAGYRDKNAVRLFHFAQFALGVGMLAIGVIYALIAQSQGGLSTQALVIATIGPGAVGYYLPQYWVQRRIQTREEEIIQGFPDALDMMLVCVEAGQSLDQSIIRVATESRAGYPALAEEFEIVANEAKAGKERVQVLKDMAERVGIPDVASFVTTLVQSATFGTSIAEALRVYSAEMRDKRVMRAEEKANTLPTKLTLGTMLFTVPPLMIILIGPSVFGIAKHLGGG